jgi:hypothetical protein
LKAISAAERPRYSDLVKRIRAAIRDRSEISNGYAFKMDGKAVTLPEAAEWVSMERLCCPFLTLQLSASGNQADWLLTLTGPIGVKQLITVEFPTPSFCCFKRVGFTTGSSEGLTSSWDRD